MRKITRIKRSIRAISPVIATLLMIAIAVVASLVAYAWVMGYIGGTTSKTGNAIDIPSYASSASNNLIVYVQNVGQGPVQLKQDGAVYVNDVLKNILQSPSGTDVTNPAGQLITIAVGKTAELVIDCPYSPPQKIKVVTVEGTFMQTGTGSGSSTVSPNPTNPPVPADHLTITSPTPVTQNQLYGGVLVTAYDASNNILTGYNGQVYFTSSDTTATLPNTASNKYTFISGDSGDHYFYGFKFTSAGTKTITVSDGSKSAISNQITVVSTGNLDYSTAMTPTSSVTSAIVSYTYTITRQISGVGINLGWANVQIPTGFTAISVTSVTTSTGQTWVSNPVIGNTISVHATNAANEITGTGQTVTVVFSATAPSSAGIYGPLLSTAYQYSSGTGLPGQLAGSDPSIVVYAVGALDHFTITGSYPTSVSAGQSFGNVIVTAYDGANNIVTGYRGQVYFTSTDSAAVLPYVSASKYTFTAADNGAHTFSGFALITAGSQTITVTDGSTAATTIAITVNAAVGGTLHFGITGAPTSTTSGVSFGGITVTIYDAYNNIATNYLGQLYFQSSDGSATLPYSSSNKYAFTAIDAGVHQFSGFTLRTMGSQTITITDGSVSTPVSITVTAPLDHFTITGYPTTVTLSQPFGGVVVTAFDSSNNVLPGYNGQVYFTAGGGGSATLPYTAASRYTFVPGDAGVQTFSGFEFGSTGGKTITVTDGTKSATTGTITVVDTSSLQYSTGMTPTSSQTSTSVSYTYTITRLSGSSGAHIGWVNITVPAGFTAISVSSVTASVGTWVSSLSGNTIIVHANAASGEITSNGQTVTVVFSATAPATPDTYGPLVSTVYTNYAGTGSPGVLNGNDPTILVYQGGVFDHFTITGTYPTTVTAGQSFGNLIVTACDVGNNAVTTYTGQVYFTSTDATATLPYVSGSRYTFTVADNGAHTFSGFTLTTAGSQRITVTDTATSATSSAITVTPAGGGGTTNPIHFIITGAPSSTTSGVSFGGVTITVYDAYNNIATNYVGQVYFQSSDGSATLPYTASSKHTFTSTDAGTHQFSGFTLITAGTQTIAVNDGTASAQVTISVTAPLDHFTITGYPTTVTISQPFGGVVVTAYDVSNNILTGYTGQIYFTANPSSGATLPYTTGSRYTFVLSDSGDHVFSGFEFSSVGGKTITVTDGLKSVTTNSINVVAAGSLHYSTAMSPLSSLPSTAVTYTYTITRTGSGSNHIGWVNITVPTGFTAISVTSVTASVGTWVSALTSNTIAVHATAASGEISSNGQTITVVFGATSPAAIGTYGPLVSTAYNSYQGGGSPGVLDGNDPSIQVMYANTLLLETNFDGTPWDQGWQAGGNPPWYSAVGQGISGTNAAKSDPVGNNNGPFTSDEMNTLSAGTIHITFQYKVLNTDAASDLRMAYSYHQNPNLQPNSADFVYFSGGGIGNPTAPDNTWIPVSITIARVTTSGAIVDPNAFASSFFFRFESSLSTHTDGLVEQVWVDSVLVTMSPP
jgi:flagellin-like protein